jgi:crotonobetainyl-CoA:carnitine CoA-transferase CaiB-like acyl-CoA transferase
MAKGLEGVRVIEVNGSGIAAAFAGKLLGDLGATVVKIEPPEGEWTRHYGPWRQGQEGNVEASALFAALNQNKRSLLLNLSVPAGFAEFATLVGAADILLHDLPPPEMDRLGLSYERLAQENPRLVMVSITPFGLTGPYRDYAACDLTSFHASGSGWIFADPRDPKGRAPVKFFGRHSEVQAAITAAGVALSCHYAALESGIGEHVDLSIQEVSATQHGPNAMEYSYAKRSIGRFMPRKFGPSDYYRCKDGSILIFCPEESQWDNFVKVMGSPAWTRDPKFATRWDRGGANREEFTRHMNAWTADRTIEEAFAVCQAAHVCATMVLTPQKVAEQEHLRMRGFIREHEHPVAGTLRLPGPPVMQEGGWWDVRSPAPRLGEASKDKVFAGPRLVARQKEAPRLPLSGVKVLDFSHFWAGPHCTQQLAFLGAEIIKIESPKRPDFTRKFNIFPHDMEPGDNRGGYFNEYNQMKQSVGIDIKTPQGLAMIKELAAQCDVAVSNFSTGVMERLGVGADTLRAINPDMIVVEISGFGKTGAFKHHIAYGPTVVPLAGIVADDGKTPLYPSSGYGDPNAGVYASFAIAAGLVARKLHGGGQTVDISLWETTAANNIEGFANAAVGNKAYPYLGNRDPVLAPHNAYPCSGEDRWIAIAANDQAQWRGLCAALDWPDGERDPRFADNRARKQNEDALDAEIGRRTQGLDRAAALKRLQQHAVPSFPVYSAGEMLHDPHLEQRGFFVELPHAEVGVRRHIGRPWKLARRPSDVNMPAPLLCEHTEQVLSRHLGLSSAQIAALRQAEIVW